jgi:Lrp/AsnC family leucine-responsive transcriptional regulator
MEPRFKPIDRIDEEIIAELTRNGRMSHAEIGLRVSLSRNAVRQRIERLERHGYIQGYTIVRGRPMPHGGLVSAILHVYRQDRMRGVEVLGALRAIPEVVSCDVLSGDFDLLVRVEARSIERVREIWEDIAGLPGVRDTVTALTLSTVIRRQPH